MQIVGVKHRSVNGLYSHIGPDGKVGGDIAEAENPLWMSFNLLKIQIRKCSHCPIASPVEDYCLKIVILHHPHKFLRSLFVRDREGHILFFEEILSSSNFYTPTLHNLYQGIGLLNRLLYSRGDCHYSNTVSRFEELRAYILSPLLYRTELEREDGERT